MTFPIVDVRQQVKPPDKQTRTQIDNKIDGTQDGQTRTQSTRYIEPKRDGTQDGQTTSKLDNKVDQNIQQQNRIDHKKDGPL